MDSNASRNLPSWTRIRNSLPCVTTALSGICDEDLGGICGGILSHSGNFGGKIFPQQHITSDESLQATHSPIPVRQPHKQPRPLAILLILLHSNMSTANTILSSPLSHVWMLSVSWGTATDPEGALFTYFYDNRHLANQVSQVPVPTSLRSLSKQQMAGVAALHYANHLLSQYEDRFDLLMKVEMVLLWKVGETLKHHGYFYERFVVGNQWVSIRVNEMFIFGPGA